MDWTGQGYECNQYGEEEEEYEEEGNYTIQNTIHKCMRLKILCAK